MQIVEFLRDPQKFQKLGGRIRGRVAGWPARHGQTTFRPGSRGRSRCAVLQFRVRTSSKCLLASARAACATCSNRARRTRPVSSLSTKSTRSVGRGVGLGGGHDEREQTLNQLLVEMDGFDPHEGIIIIAADEPARRSRLCVVASRPFRSPDRHFESRPDGSRGDSEGSCARGPARWTLTSPSLRGVRPASLVPIWPTLSTRRRYSPPGAKARRHASGIRGFRATRS